MLYGSTSGSTKVQYNVLSYFRKYFRTFVLSYEIKYESTFVPSYEIKYESIFVRRYCTFVRKYIQLHCKLRKYYCTKVSIFEGTTLYFRTFVLYKVLSYFRKYHTVLPEVFSKVQLQRCTVQLQSIDLTFVRKYESTFVLSKVPCTKVLSKYESTKVRKYESTSTFEGSVRVHVRVVRDGLELSLFAIRSTFVHS